MDNPQVFWVNVTNVVLRRTRDRSVGGRLRVFPCSGHYILYCPSFARVAPLCTASMRT